MLITFYLALLAKCSSSASWCALLGLGRGVVFAQVRILSSGRMCECDEERKRERGRESESLPAVWGRLLAATKIRAHTQRLRAAHTHSRTHTYTHSYKHNKLPRNSEEEQQEQVVAHLLDGSLGNQEPGNRLGRLGKISMWRV